MTGGECYMTFLSKVHKEEYKEEEFTKEQYYGTEFIKVKHTEEYLAELNAALPKEGEKLGYPPVNDFVPNDSPVTKKLDIE